MKRIATAALLIYVAVSAMYIVVKAGAQSTAAATAASRFDGEPVPSLSASQPGDRSAALSAAAGVDKSGRQGTEENAARIVACYFHGNLRCSTCLTIEAQAREIVESGFAREIQSGLIEWRVVNFDQPGNEHFIEDFQLPSSSLVLLKEQKGTVLEFNILQDVWQLYDKPAEFDNYVRGEILAMLTSGDSRNIVDFESKPEAAHE